MAKLFIILAYLLALIFSKGHALFPFPDLTNADGFIVQSNFPAPATDCRSNITDIVECLPFFLDDQSRPDETCCSAIESIVLTDADCICETMGIYNLPLDVIRAMTLPTICGVALPCDGKEFHDNILF